MTETLNIALAQLNPVVGDIAGNAAKIRTAREQAAEAGADLVVYSELVLVIRRKISCSSPPFRTRPC